MNHDHSRHDSEARPVRGLRFSIGLAAMRHRCAQVQRPLEGCRLAAFVSAAALILTPVVTLAQTTTAAMSAQSTIAGVTVRVSPVSLGEAGRPVDFSVVFDTHSTELTDDLMQSATLTLPDGQKLKPARWNGAGPGGHHREGVLSFEVPNPVQGPVELSITRPGESSPRVFRFQR